MASGSTISGTLRRQAHETFGPCVVRTLALACFIASEPAVSPARPGKRLGALAFGLLHASPIPRPWMPPPAFGSSEVAKSTRVGFTMRLWLALGFVPGRADGPGTVRTNDLWYFGPEARLLASREPKKMCIRSQIQSSTTTITTTSTANRTGLPAPQLRRPPTQRLLDVVWVFKERTLAFCRTSRL